MGWSRFQKDLCVKLLLYILREGTIGIVGKTASMSIITLFESRYT